MRGMGKATNSNGIKGWYCYDAYIGMPPELPIGEKYHPRSSSANQEPLLKRFEKWSINIKQFWKKLFLTKKANTATSA